MTTIWRSLSRPLLGAALFLTLLGAAALAVNGQPPYMLPSGTVYINGQPAEDGTLVEATIAGEVITYGHTYTEGEEKGQYVLTIPGEAGDKVDFFVMDIEADENPVSWTPGVRYLDLNIGRAELVTEIAAPEIAGVGAIFDVSATVTNVATGDGRAISVTVTLAVTGTALLVEDETPQKPIGDLGAGVASAPVTWTVRCMGSGPATARVVPGGIEERTGSPVPEDFLASDEATVLQRFMMFLFPILSNYAYAQ